jgi:hypothetical protein
VDRVAALRDRAGVIGYVRWAVDNATVLLRRRFRTGWHVLPEHVVSVPRGDRRRSREVNLFYGFPNVPWRPPNLVRIAVDKAVHVIADPDQRQISPAANDLQITADFVARHCVGVDDRPNVCGTCLQANVPDNMYVLDTLPE